MCLVGRVEEEHEVSYTSQSEVKWRRTQENDDSLLGRLKAVLGSLVLLGHRLFPRLFVQLLRHGVLRQERARRWKGGRAMLGKETAAPPQPPLNRAPSTSAPLWRTKAARPTTASHLLCRRLFQQRLWRRAQAFVLGALASVAQLRVESGAPLLWRTLVRQGRVFCRHKERGEEQREGHNDRDQTGSIQGRANGVPLRARIFLGLRSRLAWRIAAMAAAGEKREAMHEVQEKASMSMATAARAQLPPALTLLGLQLALLGCLVLLKRHQLALFGLRRVAGQPVALKRGAREVKAAVSWLLPRAQSTATGTARTALPGGPRHSCAWPPPSLSWSGSTCAAPWR